MIVGVVAACGSAGPAVGRERGPCRADETCEPGLQCLSKVCVEVAGERCEQVGERARSLLVAEARTRPLLAAALGDMPARIAALLSAACTEDGWSRAAQRCVLDARDHDRLEACLGDLPPSPRAALARREAELAAGGDRVEHDVPPDPPPTWPSTQPSITDPPALTLTGSQLGPECEAYLAMLTRYGRCPTLPPQARRSINETVVNVRRSFVQVPAASRNLMEDGCRQGGAAMTTALTQLGCP
jgi:hypothetical protein